MENIVFTIESYIQISNIYLDDTSITYKMFYSYLPSNLDYIIYGVKIPLYYYINTCKTCNIESDYLIYLPPSLANLPSLLILRTTLNQRKELLKSLFELHTSTNYKFCLKSTF